MRGCPASSSAAVEAGVAAPLPGAAARESGAMADVPPWPPLLTGYLYKRGKGASFFGRKTWKKRWFQLLVAGPGAGADEPVAVLEYYSGEPKWGHAAVGRYALNDACRCERPRPQDVRALGKLDFDDGGGVFLNIVDDSEAEPTRLV